MYNIFTMLSSMQCIGTGALVIFSVLNIILFFVVLTIKNSRVLNRKQIDIDLLEVYHRSSYLRDKLYSLHSMALVDNRQKTTLLKEFDAKLSEYDGNVHKLLYNQMQGDYPCNNINNKGVN